MKKLIAVLLSVSTLCTGFVFSASAEKESEEIAFVPGQEYSGEAYAPTEEINYSESNDTISYSDISDYTAVGILGALDIMSAAEAGKFKPKAYVSRGEYVEGILKTFAVRYADGVFEKDGSFYDMDETSPYYAAVATAVSAGFVSGFEDNTFRPNEVISYDNAIACIMKALGFSDDYDQSFANRVRGLLMKNVDVKEPKAITRMEMAQILYNALNIPMKNIAQFAKIGLFRYVDDDFYDSITDETILNYVWHMDYADGLLEANYIESLGSEEAREGSVVIGGVRYATKDLNNLDWLGMKVRYYYDRDENLIYMHKQKKVEELIVEADDVIGFNSATRVFSYYGANEKVNNITLKDNYAILYNGQRPKTRYNEDIFNIKEGRIRLVANDGGKYAYVFIEEYRNFIMDAFSVDDTEFKFTLGEDMTYFTVDTNYTYLEAYDKNFSRKEIYRETEEGEATMDTSVFEADSVISVYAPYGAYDTNGKLKNTGSFIKIVVSPDRAEGTIKSVIKRDSTKITIDDTVYNVSKSAYIDDLDIQVGAIQAFYIDAAGELVLATEPSNGDDWEYAYLVHIVYDGDKDYPSALKVFNCYGSMETYNVTENLKINDKKMKAGKTQQTLEASAALIGKANLKYQQLIMIKTKDTDNGQEITHIRTVLASNGVPAGYSEDWLQRNDSGTYSIASDVTNILTTGGNAYGAYSRPKYMFTVPSSEEKDESFFDLRNLTGNDLQIDLYNINEYLEPKVGIRYASSTTNKPIYTNYSANGISPVMLRDSWTEQNEDDVTVLKFEVVQCLGAVEYYSEDLNLLDDYDIGDVFILYGNGKKVSSVSPLMYNGEVIGPDNLPDVSNTGQITVTGGYGASQTYCYELYSVESAQKAIGQNGAIGSDGKREVQTVLLNDYKAWQMGGLIHYKEENGRAEVMQASFDQCTEAKQYGSDEATVIIAFMHSGRPRCMLMYTLDR